MGRIWLCEEEIAKHPFLLEEEGRRLYSFEELCYYLYQNTGVLEESFFNEKLCQWLEEEIGLSSLAESLRQGIEQERSGCWCMEQILKAGGYYSSGELESALMTAKHMEDKTPLDREKLRGDRLLKAEKYRDAIFEYRKAIAHAGQEGGDGIIIGRIWHNMGTAYARQMLFAQAAECYGKAYETSQEEVSRESHLLALASNDGRTVRTAPGRLAAARRELELRKQSGDRSGYERMLEDTLQELRAAYRKSE